MQATEACDDGNHTDGDGCSSCLLPGGAVWAARGIGLDVDNHPDGGIAILWYRCVDDVCTKQITRFSQDGDELESFVVPGLDSESVSPGKLLVTNDGDYLLCLTLQRITDGRQEQRSRIVIARYSSLFAEVWRRELPHTEYHQVDYCNDIALSGRAMIIGGLSHEGYSGELDQDNFMLVGSIDVATGDAFFMQRYRDADQFSASAVDVASDGRIAVAGRAGVLVGSDAEPRPFTALLDAAGNPRWRIVDRTAVGGAHGVSIRGDGTVVRMDIDARYDAYSIQMDAASGALLSGSRMDLAHAWNAVFAEGTDGGYVIAAADGAGRVRAFAYDAGNLLVQDMFLDTSADGINDIAMDDARIYAAYGFGVAAYVR